MHRLTAVLILLLCSLASAQTASFARFGRGCTTSGPPPLLNARTLPKLGTNFTVTYTGPNGRTPVSIDQPVLLTGRAQVNVTIPRFSNLQPGNCVLYTVPILLTVMPWTGSRFQDSVTLAIPNSRTLLGLTLYQQFVDVYFSCRPNCQMLMLRTTNGGKIVIGT